ARADAFCMKIDASVLPNILPVAEKRLAAFARPLFFFDLLPTGLTRLTPYGSASPATAPDLGGSPYSLLCATGNPEHVRQTAMRLLGREPADCFIMQDHHHYTETDALTARRLGHPIVCTAKDAVKLVPLLPLFGDIPVWTLDARAVFSEALFTDQPFASWWEKNLRRLRALTFG
ncbi:MAG: tetraacyldisaccharide 4'-kinase, partial [Deltaproteobacteria bacterium]|nr:tetraacyldisaccharide 4'-kinase [Deltaproteobacteria bacterium]